MLRRICATLSLVFIVLVVLVVAAAAPAQFPLGLANDRSHPELKWTERETEHFIVIYHQGLEDLAVRAATVAEQVYEPITKALEIEMPRKTSILLSAEDQTVNGFALPDRMFIWVNVNDYARSFGGTDKWLRGVIAHEFQHNVLIAAAMDWTGVLSLARLPAWFIEGMAEYETEEWGADRSDLALRTYILRNRHEKLDPHDSGFTKVRYLAETYGDSALVAAVKKRGFLGIGDFGRGFREATGVSVKEFDEEWRRVATAHTYAVLSQKEQITDVGEHAKSPVRRLRAVTYSPDGEQMAVLFRPPWQLPILAVAPNDSMQKTVVVDHGILDAQVGFSPDGEQLVYAKKHRSHHGSILWDLKVTDLSTGNSRWITEGRRASHPHWSPAGDRIVFTAIDGSTTNLYTCDSSGENVRPLTDHPLDVQVFGPKFSPDGNAVVYSKFEEGRGIDIALLELERDEARYLTESAAHDLNPFFDTIGENVFFTSDRNADEVPNVFTVPVAGDGASSETRVECMSDVGEALFAMDYDSANERVMALAMATVDTVRLRAISPDRRTTVTDPVIDARFTSWRDRVPPYPIAPIDFAAPPAMTEPRPYRSIRHLRPLLNLPFPSPELWGVSWLTIWMDRAHRNVLTASVDLGTKGDGVGLRWLYAQWTTNRIGLGIPGFLTATAAIDARNGARIYGNEPLYDFQKSYRLGWRLPLNAGEHLYARHNVELFGDFSEVDVHDPEDIDVVDLESRGLPAPLLNYQENTLGLLYRYQKSRPHRRANAHAHTGHGLWALFEWTDEGFGSDVEFRRLSLDATKVVGMPLLGGGLFARARLQSVWGSPAPQDFTGLRADPPILPLHYGSAFILGDAFDLDESFFQRGFARNVPGEQATLTTLEWRLPLSGPLPVSAFGFGVGGITGVLFYDQGRVWNDGSETLARHSVGWEVRAALTLGGSTFVVPSYGEGQLLDWERGDASFERDEYFRIAMTQPF